MNCNEAEELMGAYALDALIGDEADAMRVHLASCAEHAAKGAELRAAASGLYALAEPVAAPPALRSRILASIAETPQERPGSAASVAAAAPVRFEGRRDRAPRARLQWAPSRSMFGALAAAVIVLVGGLIAWNVVLMNRLDRGDAERFARSAPAVHRLEVRGPSGTGAVVYFGDEKRAVVVLDGVEALDSNMTYQMWTLGAGGEPTSAGLLATDAGGRARSVVDIDAAAVSGFAVTIEPAGGSPAPTSDPVFVTEI